MDRPYNFTRWDRFDDEIESGSYAKAINAIREAMEEIMWESTERVIVKDERTGEIIFNERGTFA